MLDVVLEPGDAMYLPAGFLHAAQALGTVSAHMTVGVHTWNRMHLLQQAFTLLGDVEQLREPLPMGIEVTDPVAMRSELDRALAMARDALPRVDADAVVAALGRHASQSSRSEPVAPLRQSELAGSLADDTRLRLRRHLAVRLGVDDPQDGAGLLVETAEGCLRLPSAARDALTRLIHGEQLTVGQLGRDTARTLVRAALVVAAD